MKKILYLYLAGSVFFDVTAMNKVPPAEPIANPWKNFPSDLVINIDTEYKFNIVMAVISNYLKQNSSFFDVSNDFLKMYDLPQMHNLTQDDYERLIYARLCYLIISNCPFDLSSYKYNDPFRAPKMDYINNRDSFYIFIETVYRMQYVSTMYGKDNESIQSMNATINKFIPVLKDNINGIQRTEAEYDEGTEVLTSSEEYKKLQNQYNSTMDESEKEIVKKQLINSVIEKMRICIVATADVLYSKNCGNSEFVPDYSRPTNRWNRS